MSMVHNEVPHELKLIAPALTPERLYLQDKRAREWNAVQLRLNREFPRDSYRTLNQRRHVEINNELRELNQRRRELVEERERIEFQISRENPTNK